MKQLAVSLLSLSLLSTAVFSKEQTVEDERSSGLFVGIDHFQGESELSVDFSGFGSSDEDFDQTGYRIKFGVQDQNNIRFQGYLKIEDFDDAFDEKIYGFGADALFTIPTESGLRPFFLLGFSSDYTELDDEGIEYSEDTISAFAFKAGLGALYKLNKNIEIQAGYDIQYRTWQDIKMIDSMSLISTDVELDDQSNTFYAGLNFFF